jgi:hypothetical protein
MVLQEPDLPSVHHAGWITCRWLVGTADPVADVRARHDALGGEDAQGQSLAGMYILLTASLDFFRPSGEGSRMQMPQTCCGLSGGFGPIRRPLFYGIRLCSVSLLILVSS